MTFRHRLVIKEAPTAADVCVALRRRWWLWLPITVALAASIFFLVHNRHTANAPPEVKTGILRLTSSPVGAAVEIDGRQSGQTPAVINVQPGRHQVRIATAGYLSTSYQADVAAGATSSMTTELWLAQPRTTQLLPPLPGASVTGANFLQDGRVALSVAVPPGDERQLWIEGPASEQRHIGPALARASVAASLDANLVAYLGSPANPGSMSQPPTQLWVTRADGQQPVQRYALPTQSNGGSDQLIDVTWAPDGRHLLLVVKQAVAAGGQRSTIDLLATDDGEPRALVSLPSDIVQGSYSWSPDGAWVSFVTVAGGKTSLCLLGLANGEFRYLGDLSTSGLSHPLPFGPASWSTNGGRLLYSASNGKQSDPASWLLGSGGATALFTVNPMAPVPQLFSDGLGQAPAWLPDGSVVALARGKGNGPIILRHLDGDGPPVDGPPLAVTSGPVYSAKWDMAHAQALIAVRSDGLSLSGDADQYWLAHFRPDGKP